MSAGNILALCGWFLFALAFFLALRAPGLARLLGGLAAQHRIHHYTGLGSAGLLFMHGSFELISDPDTALTWSDPFLVCAWIAMFFLLAAVALSFSSRIPHRLWMWLHWSLAAAWILGFLHGNAFLQPEPFDQVVFIAGSLLATGSIAAALMLKAWHGPWVVQTVKRLGPVLHEIELVPSARRARTFRAGTIVFAKLPRPFSAVWHPFSVASCRFDPAVRLLVKSAGRDTDHIEELKPGDKVDLLGPFVEFRPQTGEQVWIAGGVGVAPFLGMTRCLDYTRGQRVRLFVFHTKEEPALTREFNDFKNRHAGFDWQQAVEAGLPNFQNVLKARDELHNPEYFICGPKAFMKSARKFLTENGVSQTKVKTEEYNPW